MLMLRGPCAFICLLAAALWDFIKGSDVYHVVKVNRMVRGAWVGHETAHKTLTSYERETAVQMQSLESVLS